MVKAIITVSLGIFLAAAFGCAKGGAANSGSAPGANSNAPAPPVARPELTSANANSAAANPAPPASENANASGQKDSGTTSDKKTTELPDVQKLVGTYDLRQMEKRGVTVIMSKLKTQIVFGSDGRYSLATTDGKTTHTESGQFHIEGDTLVFEMILSDKEIETKPLRKSSKMQLNSDGRELRVISKKGNVAVFFRTA
jgi:hypothetical protein